MSAGISAECDRRPPCREGHAAIVGRLPNHRVERVWGFSKFFSLASRHGTDLSVPCQSTQIFRRGIEMAATLTTSEAAVLWRMPVRQILIHIFCGEIAAVKKSGRWLIDPNASRYKPAEPIVDCPSIHEHPCGRDSGRTEELRPAHQGIEGGKDGGRGVAEDQQGVEQ